jgi:hypothetical protein
MDPSPKRQRGQAAAIDPSPQHGPCRVPWPSAKRRVPWPSAKRGHACHSRHTASPRPVRLATALFAAAILALLLNAGCTPNADLRFTLSTDSRITLVSYKDPYFPEPIDIAFSECTYETDASGDLQITARQRQFVLATSDPSPAEYARESVAGRPSTAAADPLTALPLERILHIHVYWQPHPGVTFSNQTATTATIHYVVATQAGTASYTGTAFAYPTWRRDDTLELDLESANLQLDTATGDTPASLGPARLTGKLFARRDPFRTVDLMRQADQHAAGTPLAEPARTEPD